MCTVFSMTSPVLRNDFYMTDILSCAQTLKEAKELHRQLIARCKREGMTLHKWFGNYPELSLNLKEYDFAKPTETQTLGVSWSPVEDYFSFKIQAELAVFYTKRSILSTIAIIFNPLRLLGPVMSKAKIFIQLIVLLAKSLSLDDVIPSDYDRHSPPKLSKGETSLPVNVSVHLWVIQIRSVDEVDMDFKMDVVVRQMWEDHRLLFPDDRSNKLILDASWGNLIWTPDVWFKNALDTKLQQWVLPSVFYWLMKNRTVYFSGRVTLQLSCDMNMKKYPHDSQTCGVSIISLMSPTSDMQLNWIHPESIRVSRLLNLPQFEVGNLSLSRCDTALYGDVFSCIAAYFTLTRRSGYFVINIYIPTVLIVFMSMLTFWIPPEAVPARITMGVTSLLTIITKQYQSTMPSVSYIVALNIWLSSCIAFVFFSLLEYAVVISLVKKERITPTTQVSSQNTRRN
ncbi:glycine receptor subunit alpha-2 [Caerostris darwini]|uniref:Glycine receptor subunit alpha-2 n=1 Tax=Caerostris darwini TaxID=1538125 RepID=A0AAV4P9N5_9ARAC|nr:glycine receptor subunit alpha-2 [Caerostris darwini]